MFVMACAGYRSRSRGAHQEGVIDGTCGVHKVLPGSLRFDREGRKANSYEVPVEARVDIYPSSSEGMNGW